MKFFVIAYEHKNCFFPIESSMNSLSDPYSRRDVGYVDVKIYICHISCGKFFDHLTSGSCVALTGLVNMNFIIFKGRTTMLQHRRSPFHEPAR